MHAEFSQLIIDDSVDVNSISLYPKDVRENIFKVSTHPEGIAKIDDAQKKSQESFKKLISSFSKAEQQKIWNLTRYDDLISQLASAKGRKKKIEILLQKFPSDIHDDALEYGTNQKELIASLDDVNKNFNSEFNSIASAYPAGDQEAFRNMLSVPEAFSLLSTNMHLTVHLGDMYKTDPVFLRQQFDSLNLVAAEQKTREAEEWKKEMKENPEAQSEMRESATEYAKENGYEEKDYSESDPRVVEHYVYVPYPYWSGYPWWYEYPYWYPYPYWYHSGFYIWNGEVIWIGPPSWYFVHWHFHHHPHFYHYPHITNVYINHYYYGPRKSFSRNSVEVQEWMNANETSLPRDFKTNTLQRVDRIREFGKMEIDRDNFNKANPGKTISRTDFVKEHSEEYPHLKQPVVSEPVRPTKTDVNPYEVKPGGQPKEKQKPGVDRPKSNPPAVKNPSTKPEHKEPVQVKPPQKSQPQTKPVERKPEVSPRQVPSKPATPSQPKKETEPSGKK